MDNRGWRDFAQVCNIDVKREVDAGETIFSLFPGIPNDSLIFIIKLKPHTVKNSTCD